MPCRPQLSGFFFFLFGIDFELRLGPAFGLDHFGCSGRVGRLEVLDLWNLTPHLTQSAHCERRPGWSQRVYFHFVYLFFA